MKIIDDWDKIYEEQARQYAVLPDWPLVREVGRLKAAWHQVKFMQYDSYQIYHYLNFLPIDGGQEFSGGKRAFIPSQNPLSYIFHSWDQNDNQHPGAAVVKAEMHIQDRNQDQCFTVDGGTYAAQRMPRDEVTKNLGGNNCGVLFDKQAGLRPRIIKTEDFNWHANGLFYPTEGFGGTNPEVPIFSNKEQQRKYMGRFFTYKENVFGKKFHGHDTYDEKYLPHTGNGPYQLTKGEAH